MKNAFFVLLAMISIALPISGYSQLALSTENNSSPFAVSQFEGEPVSDTTLLQANLPVHNVSTAVFPKEVSSKELYSAYNLFKDKKMTEVAVLMSEYGFKKELMKTMKIAPKGTIDSLVLVRRDDSEIVFSMVDLGYLKSVNARMIIDVGDAIPYVSAFGALLEEDGYRLCPDRSIPALFSEFQRVDEYWIVDKRWQRWTYTKFTSLYNFVLSRYGKNKLAVYFQETVPEQWVNRHDVPLEKRY